MTAAVLDLVLITGPAAFITAILVGVHTRPRPGGEP